MPVNNEYKRYFIILQEDAKNFGIGEGKAPTGYVKIEIKNGSCKVSAFIQNMKADKNLDYRLLIIAPEDGIGLDLGRILVDECGRGELNLDVTPDNVLDSGCEMAKFSVAALGVGDRFPLSGYMGKEKMNWKGKYSVINDKKTENRSNNVNNVLAEFKIEKENAGNSEMAIEKRESGEEKTISEEREEVQFVEEKYDKTEPVEEKCEEVEVTEEKCEEVEVTEEKCEEIEIREEKCEEEKCEEEFCECPEYKCCDMCDYVSPCDEEAPLPNKMERAYDREMDRQIGRTLRKLTRCISFEDDDCEWFRVENNMRYLDKATIRCEGQMMPMSYPLLRDEMVMKNVSECMIGVKYDENGDYIKYIIYAIPGDNLRQIRKYYSDLGFTDYKNGYYFMYIDITI